MLPLVLGALVVVLAGALVALLRRAARVRAEAEAAAARLAQLRVQVEHASASLARSAFVTSPTESALEATDRRPRERRRSRRSQSPSPKP
ncbi:MAG: hypothetical protein AAGJ11_18460 [Bacteroidota bacterium]